MENANRNAFQQLRNKIEKEVDFKVQSYCSTKSYAQPIVFSSLLTKNNVKLSLTYDEPIKENIHSEIHFKITGQVFYELIEFIKTKCINEDNNSNINTIYDYLYSDVLSISTTVKPLNVFKPSESKAVNHEIFENKKNVRSESKFDDYDSICTPKYHSLICKLIESEHKYIGELHNLYHYYALYFKRESFQHFSEIYDFLTIIEKINFEQETFCKQLATYKSIEDIASHFLENEKLFALYRNYILNVNDAINFLTIKHRFELLKREQELKHLKTLDEYLLSPIERLNEYVSLLRKLETHIHHNRTLSTKLNTVLLIFKKLLNTANSDTKIVESIIDRPQSLVTYGGFIMNESFYIRKISTSFKTMVFLFQEVVIFTIPKDRERYTYANSIFMKDLFLRPISDVQHSFELMDFYNRNDNNKKNVYVLETSSPTVKDKWVDVIQSLLWEQLMICKRKAKEHVVYERF